MTLTKDYKETVLRRIRSDPAFGEALLKEAISALTEGDTTTALSLLRDLVHAFVGFKALAEKTNIGEKSLYRMFSVKGNPSLQNFSKVVRVVKRSTEAKVHHHDRDLVEA